MGFLSAIAAGEWHLHFELPQTIVHPSVQVVVFTVDVFVGSLLIKLYAENGCIKDAQHLFGEMPQKDYVLWNVMLSGFVGV